MASLLQPISAALGGFVGGLVATGSLKGALFGALTGAVAAGIGNAFQMSWAGKLGKFKELSRAMAHGISGGVNGDLQGGRFGAGFLSGSFSSMASSYGPMNGKGYTAELIQAAVTGGTGSVLGGGKFENGAVTGAFTYIFNEGLHKDPSGMDRAIKRGLETYEVDDLEIELTDEELIEVNKEVEKNSKDNGGVQSIKSYYGIKLVPVRNRSVDIDSYQRIWVTVTHAVIKVDRIVIIYNNGPRAEVNNDKVLQIVNINDYNNYYDKNYEPFYFLNKDWESMVLWQSDKYKNNRNTNSSINDKGGWVRSGPMKTIPSF